MKISRDRQQISSFPELELEFTANGQQGSFWVENNVLILDYNSMYLLKSLNCILKMSEAYGW